MSQGYTPVGGRWAVPMPAQHIAAEQLAALFDASPNPTATKIGNAAMWMPRQDLTRLLLRHELFKKVVDVHGSIVECGVGTGGGILSWLNFSAIYEPVNHQRRVIGFDTFEGFPELSDEDAASTSEHAHVGGLAVDSYDEINACATFHNLNRPIPNVNKLELVRGDARETIPGYIHDNPHLLVSLLYMDFDVYAPTAVALRNFVPRMPAGAVIAFDEVNVQDWPGETTAMLDYFGEHGRDLQLQRYPWGPTTCYAVL